MAAKIKAKHPSVDVELVPGGKGDFIVTQGNTELWNKKKMGDQFPNEADIVDRIVSPP